jgi:hypothetical protein
MRSMRIGWKRVTQEFSCDRTTAWRWYTAAILVIAAKHDSRIEHDIRAA